MGVTDAALYLALAVVVAFTVGMSFGLWLGMREVDREIAALTAAWARSDNAASGRGDTGSEKP